MGRVKSAEKQEAIHESTVLRASSNCFRTKTKADSNGCCNIVYTSSTTECQYITVFLNTTLLYMELCCASYFCLEKGGSDFKKVSESVKKCQQYFICPLLIPKQNSCNIHIYNTTNTYYKMSNCGEGCCANGVTPTQDAVVLAVECAVSPKQ